MSNLCSGKICLAAMWRRDRRGWRRTEAIITDSQGAVKRNLCLNRMDTGFTLFILSKQEGLCPGDRNADLYLLIKFYVPLV